MLQDGKPLQGNDNVVDAILWSYGQIIDLGALSPTTCSVPYGDHRLVLLIPCDREGWDRDD